MRNGLRVSRVISFPQRDVSRVGFPALSKINSALRASCGTRSHPCLVEVIQRLTRCIVRPSLRTTNAPDSGCGGSCFVVLPPVQLAISIPELRRDSNSPLRHTRQSSNNQSCTVIIQPASHFVYIRDRVLDKHTRMWRPTDQPGRIVHRVRVSKLTSLSSTSVHQNSTPSHSPLPRMFSSS